MVTRIRLHSTRSMGNYYSLAPLNLSTFADNHCLYTKHGPIFFLMYFPTCLLSLQVKTFVLTEEKCKYLEATFNEALDRVPCEPIPGK